MSAELTRGQLLRLKRKAHGITQMDLARRLGKDWSQTMVSLRECDSVAMDEEQLATAVAAVLQIAKERGTPSAEQVLS